MMARTYKVPGYTEERNFNLSDPPPQEISLYISFAVLSKLRHIVGDDQKQGKLSLGAECIFRRQIFTKRTF